MLADDCTGQPTICHCHRQGAWRPAGSNQHVRRVRSHQKRCPPEKRGLRAKGFFWPGGKLDSRARLCLLFRFPVGHMPTRCRSWSLVRPGARSRSANGLTRQRPGGHSWMLVRGSADGVACRARPRRGAARAAENLAPPRSMSFPGPPGLGRSWPEPLAVRPCW